MSYARPIPFGGIRHVTVTFLVFHEFGVLAFAVLGKHLEILPALLSTLLALLKLEHYARECSF